MRFQNNSNQQSLQAHTLLTSITPVTQFRNHEGGCLVRTRPSKQWAQSGLETPQTEPGRSSSDLMARRSFQRHVSRTADFPPGHCSKQVRMGWDRTGWVPRASPSSKKKQ